MPNREEMLITAAESAYRVMKQHYRRCPLCNPQYECVSGIKLRGAWQALDDETGKLVAAAGRGA